GAFEPLGGGAPRHPTAEMDAALVQGHEPTGGHIPALVLAGESGRGRNHVSARLGDEEGHDGAVAVAGLTLDVCQRPGDDVGAEAAGDPRPQESEESDAQTGGPHPEGGAESTVE